jgi:cystathionine gamma-synthase
MTHASMDEAARATAGIEESLLRLSVGIEHADDLVADLAAALDVAGEHVRDSYSETEQTHVRATV